MLNLQTQISWIAACLAVLNSAVAASAEPYKLGSLPDPTAAKGKPFGIAGDVYVVSDRVIEVRSFNYNGGAPDPFFWAHRDPEPKVEGGVILQDTSPTNTCGASTIDPRPANGTNTFRLEIPDGLDIYEFQGGSISFYCRAMFVNLGHVVVPENLSDIATFEDTADEDLFCVDVETDSFGLYDRFIKPIVYITGMAKNFLLKPW